MRSTFALFLIALLATGVYAVFIGAHASENNLLWAGDLAILLASSCATLAALIAWNKTNPRFAQERRGWLICALSLLLFTLGEVYWAYHELVLRVEVPIGGFADIAWTFAYLLLIAGVFKLSSLAFQKDNKRTSILLIFTTLALIYASYAALTLPKENAVAVLGYQLYVAYDLILLGIIIPILIPLVQSPNKFTIIWVLLALFVGLRVIFDFLFAGLIAVDLYSTGHPADLIYIASYVIATLAADKKNRILP